MPLLRFERRWMKALLEAFALPHQKGLSPQPGEVDYLSTAETMMRSSTTWASFGIRAALWLIAWSPFWLYGKVQSISALSLRERSDLLRGLLCHPRFAVRELAGLLKIVACFALLGTASVRARANYDRGVAVAYPPFPRQSLSVEESRAAVRRLPLHVIPKTNTPKVV